MWKKYYVYGFIGGASLSYWFTEMIIERNIYERNYVIPKTKNMEVSKRIIERMIEDKDK